MRNRKLSDTEKNILDTAKIHAPDVGIITVVEFIDGKKTFDIHRR